MTELLDETSAARLLRLRPQTLRRWRHGSRGPTYHKIGGAVRYRPEDLQAFVEENRVVLDA
jgi:hypothetical protein